MVNQFKSEVSGNAQIAKLGAKLEYINRLNNKCPEGYEVEKFLLGGKPCSRCKKVKKVKIEKSKNGSAMDDIRDEISKKRCGGKAKKMQDGGRNIHPSLIEYRKRLEEEKNKSIEWKKKRDAFLENAERPLIERWISSFFTSDNENTNSTKTSAQTSVNDNSKDESQIPTNIPDVVVYGNKPNISLIPPKPNLSMGVIDYSLSKKFPYSSTDPKPKTNPDISIVDYLISKGMDNSYDYRHRLWQATNIGNGKPYKGTAEQNTALLNYMKPQLDANTNTNTNNTDTKLDSGTLYG